MIATYGEWQKRNAKGGEPSSRTVAGSVGDGLTQSSQDPRTSQAPSTEGNREEPGAGSLLREVEQPRPRPRGGSSLFWDEAQATGAGAL